jgi:hypothetical protein
MAEPSKKSEQVEQTIASINGGVDRRTMIDADLCTACGGPATDFKDALSKREYSISGFCQKCQDSIFA